MFISAIADELVLRGISFVAEPGKLTALVGPSGSGKTTIINVPRFYDAERGKIVIDGRISGKSRAARCAGTSLYVGQDASVPRHDRRQHCLRQARRREDEIVAAAKGAYAHDLHFVLPCWARLRHAGRRTRAATVRRAAPARRHRARLNQECADHPARRGDRRRRHPESELAVREAMEHLRAGRTTVAIAHRLHTVSHADRIYVIEEGQVVDPAGTTNRCAKMAAIPRLPAPAANAGKPHAGRSGRAIGAQTAAFSVLFRPALCDTGWARRPPAFP